MFIQKYGLKSQIKMTENEISHIIIGAAIGLPMDLGPGLLESAYEHSLAHELRAKGLLVEQQVPMPLIYKEIKLDCGYRIDLLVEGKVIIEIKSVDELSSIHSAQTLTYLKLSKCKLGLLINFNTSYVKDGIKRIVNNL